MSADTAAGQIFGTAAKAAIPDCAGLQGGVIGGRQGIAKDGAVRNGSNAPPFVEGPQHIQIRGLPVIPTAAGVSGLRDPNRSARDKPVSEPCLGFCTIWSYRQVFVGVGRTAGPMSGRDDGGHPFRNAGRNCGSVVLFFPCSCFVSTKRTGLNPFIPWFSGCPRQIGTFFDAV